jgi:hypothetical protein
MRRRPLLYFVSGAILGASCAWLGISMRSAGVEAAGTLSTTSTPSSTVAAETGGSTLLSNTEIDPVALGATASEIRFEYDLVALGGSTATVVPTVWELRTNDGQTYQANTSSDETRVALFRTGPDPSVDDIDSIAIVEYAVRSPQHYEITLPLDGRPVTLMGGTTVSVRRVLEQRTYTFVQLAIEESTDHLGSELGLSLPVLTPLLPGFDQAVVAAGGSTYSSPQFRYQGDPLPPELPIDVTSATWDRIETDMAVDLGGVR